MTCAVCQSVPQCSVDSVLHVVHHHLLVQCTKSPSSSSFQNLYDVIITIYIRKLTYVYCDVSITSCESLFVVDNNDNSPLVVLSFP